eukprot:scaffold86256_cov33-Prasinocladus_malaysianus.AAC.1
MLTAWQRPVESKSASPKLRHPTHTASHGMINTADTSLHLGPTNAGSIYAYGCGVSVLMRRVRH